MKPGDIVSCIDFSQLNFSVFSDATMLGIIIAYEGNHPSSFFDAPYVLFRNDYSRESVAWLRNVT